MLKNGPLPALAICCVVTGFRHGNLCLPTCSGRWHSDSSEDLTDLTAHLELLRSDPADLAETRPSRMRWELQFQHRHAIGAGAQQLHDACKYVYIFCMEPNYTNFTHHCFGKSQRRIGHFKAWARKVEICRGRPDIDNSRTGWRKAVAEKQGPTKASSSPHPPASPQTTKQVSLKKAPE